MTLLSSRAFIHDDVVCSQRWAAISPWRASCRLVKIFEFGSSAIDEPIDPPPDHPYCPSFCHRPPQTALPRCIVERLSSSHAKPPCFLLVSLSPVGGNANPSSYNTLNGTLLRLPRFLFRSSGSLAGLSLWAGFTVQYDLMSRFTSSVRLSKRPCLRCMIAVFPSSRYLSDFPHLMVGPRCTCRDIQPPPTFTGTAPAVLGDLESDWDEADADGSAPLGPSCIRLGR